MRRSAATVVGVAWRCRIDRCILRCSGRVLDQGSWGHGARDSGVNLGRSRGRSRGRRCVRAVGGVVALGFANERINLLVLREIMHVLVIVIMHRRQRVLSTLAGGRLEPCDGVLQILFEGRSILRARSCRSLKVVKARQQGCSRRLEVGVRSRHRAAPGDVGNH